jgi:hypothetical protein
MHVATNIEKTFGSTSCLKWKSVDWSVNNQASRARELAEHISMLSYNTVQNVKPEKKDLLKQAQEELPI